MPRLRDNAKRLCPHELPCSPHERFHPSRARTGRRRDRAGLAGADRRPRSSSCCAAIRRWAADPRIDWHSPRPLSAACLVETDAGAFFIKRHHRQRASVATLGEEHRFIAHLRGRGMPVPAVLRDAHGHTAVAIGEWVYEVHERAAGHRPLSRGDLVGAACPQHATP